MSALTQWNTNETLLQSYRAIFISAQSFLLTFGGTIYGKANGLLVILCVGAILMIWFAWRPVVFSRHRIVDYYKSQITLDEATYKANLIRWPLHDYVNDRKVRADANEELKIHSNLRSTRIKLDIMLPAFFFLLWVSLLWLALPSCQELSAWGQLHWINTHVCS